MDRILHVVGGMDRGGAETMIMNLYRAIDRSNIQFDFLCMQQGKHHYDEEIEKMGGRIFYIKEPKERGVFGHILDMRNVMLKNGPFAAVHGHTNFHTGIIAIAAKMSNVKIRICHSHNTRESNNSKFFRRAYFALMKLLIQKYSTTMLACGVEAGEHLFGKRMLDRGSVEVFPNAINLEQFKIIPINEVNLLRKELNIPENAIVLGNIARFTEQKNHEFFIDFIKKLEQKDTEYRIVLVGEGILLEGFSNRINEMGLQSKVLFLGVRSDIPLLLNLFDVFIMPSLYEGLPVSIVEAQATGVPCLVSDTITEEVDMGLGLISYLNLKKSKDEWVNKIIEILNKHNNKIINQSLINVALSNKGYEITESVFRLKKIYKLK